MAQEAEFGVALYNKKLMYGMPKGNINDLSFRDVKQEIFLENGSTLFIDSKKYDVYSPSEVKSKF